MLLHVKKGDTVLVLAGKDKGKTGKVLAASPSTHRVVVDGVNIITKHRKPRSAQDQGGIEKVNGTIDASNVMIVCPSCNRATKAAHEIVDGKKVRVCKKCHASLDVKVKTEKKPAKKTAKKADTEEVQAEEVKPVKKSAKKAEAAEVPAEEVKPAKKTAKKKTDAASENTEA